MLRGRPVVTEQPSRFIAGHSLSQCIPYTTGNNNVVDLCPVSLGDVELGGDRNGEGFSSNRNRFLSMGEASKAKSIPDQTFNPWNR